MIYSWSNVKYIVGYYRPTARSTSKNSNTSRERVFKPRSKYDTVAEQLKLTYLKK